MSVLNPLSLYAAIASSARAAGRKVATVARPKARSVEGRYTRMTDGSVRRTRRKVRGKAAVKRHKRQRMALEFARALTGVRTDLRVKPNSRPTREARKFLAWLNRQNIQVARPREPEIIITDAR